MAIYGANFSHIRLHHRLESTSLIKKALNLNFKSCYPTSTVRQNVEMVLNILNEKTSFAVEINK